MRRFESQIRGRRAFTLIELLVVVTIVLVLAGLAVMFIPNMADQTRAADGAVRVQGWLNIARQRALRDQAPRGIRFYLNTTGANPQLPNTVSVEAQYIDQPDDYSGGVIQTLPGGTSANWSTLVLTGPDPLNGQGIAGMQSFWSVLPGDYIEVGGTGVVHQIAGIPAQSGGPPAPYVTLLSLAWQAGGIPSPLPGASLPVSNYRIIRQPRVSGEEKLVLPTNIGVDLSTNNTYGNPLTVGTDLSNPTIQYVDILFSPSGNVMGSQMGTSQINLWVRDCTIPINQGEPSLVVTYTRSGLVAAVPVDMSYFQGVDPTPYYLTLNP